MMFTWKIYKKYIAKQTYLQKSIKDELWMVIAFIYIYIGGIKVNLEALSFECRQNVLDMIMEGRAGHIGGDL